MKYGGPVDLTPEIALVRRLVWTLYNIDGCEVGGPLHIVTDDMNVEDGCLDFCAGGMDNWLRDWYADEYPDTVDEVRTVATSIIDALRPMSLAERATAVR